MYYDVITHCGVVALTLITMITNVLPAVLPSSRSVPISNSTTIALLLNSTSHISTTKPPSTVSPTLSSSLSNLTSVLLSNYSSSVLSNSTAMTSLSNASTPMTSLSNSSTPMTSLSNSSTPMTSLSNSSTPMTSLSNSSTPMTSLSNSSTPMTSLSNSSTPMASLSNSTTPSMLMRLLSSVKTSVTSLFNSTTPTTPISSLSNSTTSMTSLSNSSTSTSPMTSLYNSTSSTRTSLLNSTSSARTSLTNSTSSSMTMTSLSNSTSSAKLMTSSSRSLSNTTTMTTVIGSQNSNNMTASSPTTQSISAAQTTLPHLLTTVTPSVRPRPNTKGDQSTTLQSDLQIVLVKKMLQNWGYMPVKINGCWIFPNGRENTKDVTCGATTVPSVSSATPSASQPITYESISEFATSELTPTDVERELVDEDNVHGLTVEERPKFHNAMGIFQQTYRLPITGRLDISTARMIKQRVCGVPDRLGSNSEGKDVVPAGTPSRTDSGESSVYDYTSSESLLQTSGENRTSLEVTEYEVTTSSSKQTPPTLLTAIARDSAQSTVASELETATPRTRDTTELDYPFTEIVTETSSELYTYSDVAQVTPGTTVNTRTLPTIYDDIPAADTSRRRRNLPLKLQNVLQPRSRRSANTDDSNCFTTNSAIKWRIVKKYSSDTSSSPLSDATSFSRTTLRAEIAEAFSRWAKASRLSFVEQTTGAISDIDIQIRFITTNSAGTMDISLPTGCTGSSCFTGSEMAITALVNNVRYIYFKDYSARPFTHDSSSTNHRDLLTIAVHEIGHTLCLNHSTVSSSVMHPSYTPPQSPYKVFIDSASKTLVKNKYGACTDSFQAFDWVHVVNGATKYSSYLFRGNKCWLWKNQVDDYRYNDPTPTSTDWPGGIVNVRAIVQMFPSKKVYFFLRDEVVTSGTPTYNAGKSYLYDQTNMGVGSEKQWLKKSGSNYPDIPKGLALKAAYFDKTTGDVYFFNQTHVFAYDMTTGSEGCCNSGYPKAIGDAYPGRYTYTPNLETGIDGAYYSRYTAKLYFFKGDSYWVSTYNQKGPAAEVGGADVKVNAKQYNKHLKWKYICDE